MPDLMPLIGTETVLALCFVMSLMLCVSLVMAAWRNHFWRHSTRPVVLASALLMFALSSEFGKRLFSDSLAVNSPLRALTTRSGAIDDAVNLLLLVGIAAFYLTVFIAYPDVHRGDGEPHDRNSHVD